MSRFIKLTDSMIYLIVVIASAIYFVPEYLLLMEEKYSIPRFPLENLRILGLYLMPLSLLLAIWCSLTLRRHGHGTPSPSQSASQLVCRGPYAIIRQPMMCSLYVFLLAKVILFGSLFVLLWLLLVVRFGVFFIHHYEEPLLRIKFGDAHTAYCQRVPCWLPQWKRFKH